MDGCVLLTSTPSYVASQYFPWGNYGGSPSLNISRFHITHKNCPSILQCSSPELHTDVWSHQRVRGASAADGRTDRHMKWRKYPSVRVVFKNRKRKRNPTFYVHLGTQFPYNVIDDISVNISGSKTVCCLCFGIVIKPTTFPNDMFTNHKLYTRPPVP